MMKASKKGTLNWILTGILLGGFSVCCKGQVTFLAPPQNTTAIRGSQVTISCGYKWHTALLTEWFINETVFNQQELQNSSLYQLNSPTSPMTYSLTVFSINSTTTFKCVVLSDTTTTSTPGTVTVIVDVLSVVTITTPPENTTVCRGSDVIISCGHVIDMQRPVVWIINGTSVSQEQIFFSPFLYRQNRQGTPTENSLTVFSINGTTTFQCVVLSTPNTISTLGTVTVNGPNVTIESTNVILNQSQVEISISWQVATDCSEAVIMYNITVTVIDQLDSASVTVPANVLSVKISELLSNGTSIVANREYIITVSAISDHEYSYPSNSVVVNLDTFILRNCDVTSPSIGTIRVSCDPYHQIIVTLTCTNNCSNPMVIINGSSPLTVTGLDPGITYNVTINVFDGSQVVLSDQTEMRTITVMRDIPDNNESNNGGSGGGSVGAIGGGVIGGIVVVIAIVVIIIVIYFIVGRRNKESVYDDTTNLKSPPGTGGTHASEGDSNAQDDKVLYAAPAQIATIPHQTSASGEQYAVSTKTAYQTNEEQPSSVTVPHHASDNGEQYAVSTKTANKSSEKQPPSDQCDSKKGTQEITYADLQALPTDSQRNDTNHVSTVTYSQIA